MRYLYKGNLPTLLVVNGNLKLVQPGEEVELSEALSADFVPIAPVVPPAPVVKKEPKPPTPPKRKTKPAPTPKSEE